MSSYLFNNVDNKKRHFNLKNLPEKTKSYFLPVFIKPYNSLHQQPIDLYIYSFQEHHISLNIQYPFSQRK